MASSLYRMAFPYKASEDCVAHLSHLSLTNEVDSCRYSISMDHNTCSNIGVNCKSTEEGHSCHLRYISDESSASPLLLCVPASLNMLKLEIEVSQLGTCTNDDSSLLIRKSYGEAMEIHKRPHLDLFFDSDPTAGDTSEISLSKLVPENSSSTVIVNDTFNIKNSQNKVLDVSVWISSPSKLSVLFSFKIWIDEPVPDQSSGSNPSQPNTQSPLQTGLNPVPALQTGSKSDFNLEELRKTFNFNIHDGPEFRRTLAAYEIDSPKLRKAMSNLQDELRNIESAFRRLLNIRNRIVDVIDAILESSFSPVIKKLDILKKFSSRFKQIFNPLESNIKFITRDVFISSSLPKMISFCTATLNSEGNYDNTIGKKAFEKQSKEFYYWLHKYLSNEKDRPESKLLLKRKAFELSKFDYLNSLNSASNNQYFNQLLENLLKFSELPIHNGLLDFEVFRDSKTSQMLLSEDATLYLNGLSRFNSEKQQFRHMIEACRTNEELTTLIKSNPLNSSSKYTAPNTKNSQKLQEVIGLNLDMVFPNSPVKTTPEGQNSFKSSGTDLDQDQSANFSGILYAQGGQGKPGWHKEWVVLRKGQLIEYSDWRTGTQPTNKPIDVALASVKPVVREKRQFCLEIITSSGQKHTFQAINEDERSQWIKMLYNAGQLTDRLVKRPVKPKIITDFSHPPAQSWVGDDRGSPVSIFSGSIHCADENYLRCVRLVENSDNHKCADCSSTEMVEWISSNFLVVLCVKCSSCHRNMGSHISKVKSLKLDNFARESRLLLNYINNKEVNTYLEATVKEKISPTASDSERLQYIKQKYEERLFMEPLQHINSSLVRAIRKIDLHDVIRLLNCGADPNLTVQINVLSEVEPISISIFEYSLRKRVEIDVNNEDHELFAISELLILHGCKIQNINNLHPEVVDSEEAKAYWRDKRARVMAN